MKQKKLLISILLEGIALFGIPLLLFLSHQIELALTDGPGAGGQAMPGLTIGGLLLFMYWVFVIPVYVGLNILLELIANASLSQLLKGIKIYSLDENLPSIGKRIIRILSKYGFLGLIALLLMVGADTNALGILAIILCVVYLIINLYFINKKGRTVPDLAAGTIVLEARK